MMAFFVDAGYMGYELNKPRFAMQNAASYVEKRPFHRLFLVVFILQVVDEQQQAVGYVDVAHAAVEV